MSLTASIGNLEAAIVAQGWAMVICYSLFILFLCVVVPKYLKRQPKSVDPDLPRDAYTQERRDNLVQMQNFNRIKSVGLKAGFQSGRYPTGKAS